MAKYKNIVILTGAGISAESGIKTFRAQDGLWEDHRIEDVATPEAYIANPALVQNFYNMRRRNLLDPNIMPNPAHLALAKLEQAITEQYDNGSVTVITQNIDNLHERAGTQSIIHMHGELLKVRCPESNQITHWEGDLDESEVCHCCQIPNPLRPHIVWFGEMPLQMAQIHECLEHADLFISIGTSGVVYPAAGLVNEAKMHGAHSIEINLEPSAINSEFVEQRIGKASVEVPKLVDEILEII